MKIIFLAHKVPKAESDKAVEKMTCGKKGLKYGLIPNASDPIEWIPLNDGTDNHEWRIVEDKVVDYRVGWANYINRLEDKGHEVVIVDLKEDPEKVRKLLESVDIIEAGGGDVNYLLDQAKKAKLDTYLKSILEKGTLYIGMSAGSMLPLPDIGFTWWDPSSNLDRKGLGIVDFMITGTPTKEDGSTDMEKLLKRKEFLASHGGYPWKTYLLRDGQIITLDGDKIEHTGPGLKESF